MACFIVSSVAAVGVGAAKYIVRHHEKKVDPTKVEPKEYKFGSEVKWSRKLANLELTLWGGSLLLAGEHLIHGEVSFNPPFLTAAGEGPEAVSEMLTEMGTVGISMLAILVVAWAVATFIVDWFKFRKHKEKKAMEAIK